MCSNPCESELTCFRPESNRGPYGLLNLLSAALSTTELWWWINHWKSFRTLLHVRDFVVRDGALWNGTPFHWHAWQGRVPHTIAVVVMSGYEGRSFCSVFGLRGFWGGWLQLLWRCPRGPSLWSQGCTPRCPPVHHWWRTCRLRGTQPPESDFNQRGPTS